MNLAILGDRGRRRSKFVLFRRQKANGVVRSRHYKVKTPQTSSAVMDSQQHSISYTLSRNQAVIVEYTHDPCSDLFQIGRSSESPIDFVVMDTVPGNRVQDKISSQSTISRFACRIIAEREPSTCPVTCVPFQINRRLIDWDIWFQIQMQCHSFLCHGR